MALGGGMEQKVMTWGQGGRTEAVIPLGGSGRAWWGKGKVGEADVSVRRKLGAFGRL